jgi:hypothetical protein
MNQSVAFFILGSAAMLGQFLDARTTEVFLTAKVATEGNPVDAFIIKHLGFVGNYAIKCVGLPFFAVMAAVYSGFGTGMILAGGFAAFGWSAGIWNYIKCKKAGLSVF